jgi:IS6 family transposase
LVPCRVALFSHRTDDRFMGSASPQTSQFLAVRLVQRHVLSCRNVEELLAERGIEVDQVSIYRWVQTFTPLLIDAARTRRHGGGDRWSVDETYLRVSGRWMYLDRAVDQFGQVIDVVLSDKRDLPAARRFFEQALSHSSRPAEINTDRAGVDPAVIDELLPDACHVSDQYPNNRVDSDHARPVVVVTGGHALVQNIRRGHYELAVDRDNCHRVADAFDELMIAI